MPATSVGLLADLEHLMRLQEWLVTVAGQPHPVIADTALEACEIAEQAWGGWPTHIERSPQWGCLA